MTRTRVLPSLLIVLLATVAFSFSAQSASGELPKGSDVLERHTKATGGRAAYAKIKNRVIKSTLTITGQGIKLSSTTYATRPDKTYTLLVSDLVGKIEQGTSGGVAWSITTQTGPVVKKGAERASYLRLAAFDGLTRWEKLFKSAECTNMDTINKNRCYKVVLLSKPTGDMAIDKRLKPVTLYIDSKSYLLVKRIDVLATRMGDIKIESFPGDLRKVDGILIPHKTQVKVLGQDRVVTLDSVKHNVKLPKDRFQIPMAIQKLLKRDQQD